MGKKGIQMCMLRESLNLCSKTLVHARFYDVFLVQVFPFPMFKDGVLRLNRRYLLDLPGAQSLPMPFSGLKREGPALHIP